jgi:hypothetical protein
MSVEQPQPEPLDYAVRGTRRRLPRGVIVAILGAAVASAGVAVFLCAHQITGHDYDSIAAEHARLHESLWAAFGIALLLSGTWITAVGLTSWCRSEAG